MHMLGQQRSCHWQDLWGFGHTAQDDPHASCVLFQNAGTAGSVLSDANERARTLTVASMMNE